MFWGLIMEPNKRYSQKVKKAFHISMASQDVSSADEQPSQVLCSYEGRNYLLCTLQYPSVIQCPLDLNFDVGTEVSFATNGKGHIHLTGYTVDDEDVDSLTMDQLAEEEESEEEVVVEKETKKSKKKKQNSSPEVPAKKAKLVNGFASEEEAEEEEDDPDFEADEDEESGAEEAEEEEEQDEEDEDTDDDNEAVEEESEAKAPVKQEKSKKGKQPKEEQEAPKFKPKRRQYGIVYEDIVLGTGAEAKPGRFVTIYFEGRLQKNNKVFDYCNTGPGFKYRMGKCEVIHGLDIGVEGMKVGGKRKIICPPPAAYGTRGSLPAVPPNATLVFTVTLKKAK